MPETQKRPTISIVVLNWNGKRFIDTFMQSVEEQVLGEITLEVLFTDNGSSDDSIAYFNERYGQNKQYRVVSNDHNYGYAKGNNLGIAQANGEYVLICNNDLILDKRLVAELHQAITKTNAALVVPKLLFINRPGVINNAGSILQPESNWPIVEIGANEKDDGSYDTQQAITAFCGACVLFRRSFLEEVGLYDSKFFMYFEDGDLSWRGQKAGRTFYYVPKAIAHHYHTGSSTEGSPLFNHFVYRNRLLILTKNAGLRIVASGWKVTLRDNLGKRLKNILLSLRGKYSKKVALLEFFRSQKMMISALLMTPYALGKRWRIIKEDHL